MLVAGRVQEAGPTPVQPHEPIDSEAEARAPNKHDSILPNPSGDSLLCCRRSYFSDCTELVH